VPYPKPSEIPWIKELCNSVNLIDFIVNPVEIKHLLSGKSVAWTRLSKGHQIHVSGRIVTNTVDYAEGKRQTYYKVFATTNFQF
ncbi:hypothetical protein RYX36_024385, partial [Vicia faba]